MADWVDGFMDEITSKHAEEAEEFGRQLAQGFAETFEELLRQQHRKDEERIEGPKR